MAPVGVIYDLKKKHRVTMIMIQGTAKTNKIIQMYKKNTTKWEKEQQQNGDPQYPRASLLKILAIKQSQSQFLVKENASNFVYL